MGVVWCGCSRAVGFIASSTGNRSVAVVECGYRDIVGLASDMK